jgi:hypothetical protein
MNGINRFMAADVGFEAGRNKEKARCDHKNRRSGLSKKQGTTVLVPMDRPNSAFKNKHIERRGLNQFYARLFC